MSTIVPTLRARRRPPHGQQGQSLVEFSLFSLLLFAILFGLIDIGRALLLKQTIANLSREGANLASRGTPLSETLDAVIVSAQPLDIVRDGYVILSRIRQDANGRQVVSEQVSRGSLVQTSRVGSSIGAVADGLPNSGIVLASKEVLVAEIYARFRPVTPIGQMLGGSLPSVLYDAAYF